MIQMLAVLQTSPFIEVNSALGKFLLTQALFGEETSASAFFKELECRLADPPNLDQVVCKLVIEQVQLFLASFGGN